MNCEMALRTGRAASNKQPQYFTNYAGTFRYETHSYPRQPILVTNFSPQAPLSPSVTGGTFRRNESVV